MSMQLEQLCRDMGLQLASHVWATTVSSVALISAPSTNKVIRLRYISVSASAPGSVRLTTGTALATAHYLFTGTFPFAEEMRSDGDAGGAMTLHATQGVGNGFIRVYYSIVQATGTTE